MKKPQSFTLEPFKILIKQNKGKKFNLQLKLTLTVTLEILACAIITWIIDLIVNDIILKDILRIPWIAIMCVVSIIVGLAATQGLAKWFSVPIKKLRQGMEKVADGDFTVQLTTRSKSKEIREVYAGFNMMMNEINSTEILQTNFVSNVSHEIKTPISAIEGYSMLLQGCDNLSDEQREYIDKIVFNTKRLSSLTGSILLLSKLENQQIQSNKSLFSLDEQIRQAIVDLESEWEKKNIEFDVDLESVNYFGDETLLRHVWSNLIGNAIKFNKDGGSIFISMVKEDKKIKIYVKDTGIGISEDTKKHIFDKFYQGDTSHKDQGNGLGLSLVKKIISLEEGEVFADNEPDGGCKFTVILNCK